MLGFSINPVPREAMSTGRRTTHRSSTGTKLYAVRDAKGRFKDIQTYKRAHGVDLKRKAKGEVAAR
jgi:DNA-binding protein HU-beta